VDGGACQGSVGAGAAELASPLTAFFASAPWPRKNFTNASRETMSGSPGIARKSALAVSVGLPWRLAAASWRRASASMTVWAKPRGLVRF
jgi:hypothetical protein